MGGKKDNSVKETAQQRELATIGTEWARINDTRFRPLQRSLVKQAMDGGDEERRALGEANVRTQQSFAEARPKVAGSQIAAGAAPGSGRFLAATGGFESDLGLSNGLGRSDTKQAAALDLASKRQSLIDLGMGKAASGSAGLGNAAKVATETAIADAREAAAGRAARGQVLGAAAGAASSYGLDYLRKPPSARGTTAVQPANLPADYTELGWGE